MNTNNKKLYLIMFIKFNDDMSLRNHKSYNHPIVIMNILREAIRNNENIPLISYDLIIKNIIIYMINIINYIIILLMMNNHYLN